MGRYAGVVWRVLPPVSLPVEVVQRYNGSAMAVTGFEVDVVRRPAGGDVSVPNYQSYNHHYKPGPAFFLTCSARKERNKA